MHTIQVPGSRFDKTHPDDHVGFECEVKLHFQVAGDFERSAEGNYFNPRLPKGHVAANSDYWCKSPNKTLLVKWEFTADSNHSVTTGNIFVEKGADCKD